MTINDETLKAAGYVFYDGPINTGDPHCKGLYQKFFVDSEGEHSHCLMVTLWDFSYEKDYAGPLQPNLEVSFKGAMQEKLTVVGLPERWDVSDLEAYAQRYIDFMRADAQAHGNTREDAFAAMIKSRLESIKDGTAKTVPLRSMEEAVKRLREKREKAAPKVVPIAEVYAALGLDPDEELR